MEKLKGFRSSFLMYDFFGYLLPGFFFLCLIIIDYDLSAIMQFYKSHGDSIETLQKGMLHYKFDYLFRFLTWNTDSDFKFTTLIILILFCYLLGHIIAAVSSLIIEVWFNEKLLGFPSENLLSKNKRDWFQKIFKNYTKHFNENFIEKFTQIFEKRFGTEPDQKDYFWLCFSDICKHTPVGYNRITHFLKLYGFSRNIAACFLIYIIQRVFFAFILCERINHYSGLILIVYFCCSLIMIKNYLKLYYRQCAELYYHFYSLHTDEKEIPAN
jgi:hypothetical protein